MVGSGGGGGTGSDRSKEAVGMMALHEALRSVCLNSDWTYSVFWTIRPRPRSRGGSGCKVGDDNGSLMLMWEDGFCKPSVAECLEEMDAADTVRKAFSKMSIQLYNYGEGLMGKVASDKCHKWVFKEPSECEPNISNYWQSSYDALPPEWTDQFNSGIQTIAVIQAGHGLLQLGSCKIIPEDLHFVLRMRHTFESLGYQSGFFLSQLFSNTRNTTSTPLSNQVPANLSSQPPPPIFNWSQRPLPAPITASFQTTAGIRLPSKDEPHLFLVPQSSDMHMQEMVPGNDADLKWPTGLSLFNALTGRPEDCKLLFGGMDTLDEKPGSSSSKKDHPGMNGEEIKVASASDNEQHHLSLDSHSNDANKMEHKFQRSSTMPTRLASSGNATTVDDYRGSEAGIYSDVMGTFLE